MFVEPEEGNSQRSPFDILLVEDSRSDIRLVQMALAKMESPIRIAIVTTGEDAVSFLAQEPPFDEAPRPHLILLDLNLPTMNGLDVLQTIKNDPAILSIPVVVLTTSDSRRKIEAAYALHANSVMTKPVSVDDFFEAFRCLEGFWLSAAALPHERNSETGVEGAETATTPTHIGRE